MLRRTSVSLFIKDTANGSCGAGHGNIALLKDYLMDCLELYAF